MTDLLHTLFEYCEQVQASDIHLAVGQMPRFRIQGILSPNPTFPEISVPVMDEIVQRLGATSLSRERVFATLQTRGSIDGATTSPSGSRYRFNLFLNAGTYAVALRRLDAAFRSLQELELPQCLADFCQCRDGLVIITGPTGSGKSTTLATLLNQINRSRDGHIITIEDPIEYVHESRRCLVNQRQVGRDAASFHAALVEAMRQDPDVILVGEIRDLDTIRTAITAAETGHLVFTTLHAGDCAGAVERIVSVFPAEEQDGIRHQLAMVLRGVFAQHLVPAADGRARVPVYELMVVTSAVANLIATGRSKQLYSAIELGQPQGMVTTDQCLSALLQRGRISKQVALLLAHNPNALLGHLAKNGAPQPKGDAR
ncbi:MAG: PilT/PilU family type 4a pilus ATPase [Kiritimatiellae bacterium]|nr:PilT/PilU family type 4a pilus ATPase [Kiritimatiellia bacterium]